MYRALGPEITTKPLLPGQSRSVPFGGSPCDPGAGEGARCPTMCPTAHGPVPKQAPLYSCCPRGGISSRSESSMLSAIVAALPCVAALSASFFDTECRLIRTTGPTGTEVNRFVPVYKGMLLVRGDATATEPCAPLLLDE